MTREELLAELKELATPSTGTKSVADGSGTDRYPSTAHWTQYGDGTDYPADPPQGVLRITSGTR
jgi:hypothetical protein